jgi:hypothetical protein
VSSTINLVLNGSNEDTVVLTNDALTVKGTSHTTTQRPQTRRMSLAHITQAQIIQYSYTANVQHPTTTNLSEGHERGLAVHGRAAVAGQVRHGLALQHLNSAHK